MIFAAIVDRSSPVPLHAQLTRGLRAAVIEGRLAAGEGLPSSRSLAEALGVARGTVVAAYDTLVGEGYLLARPGARTVVAELSHHAVVPAEVRAAPAVAASAVIDLRPGRPGTRGLADAEWRSAWRRATASDPAPDVDDERGLPALRSEIARHLGRTRGVAVDPDDVIVTAGTSDALLLTALALPVRRADGVRRFGVEDPGYPRVRTILERLGVEMVPLPVRPGDGLDLDVVEAHRDLDAIIVTPHHHYPLGTRLDAPARARLVAWARATGIVVIEDDYDSEFPHGRAPLPPLRMIDPDGVILLGTLSKVLSPALRFGWVVASGVMRDRLCAVRADLDSPVSEVAQQALAVYLADGSLARHVTRRRRDYRHRRRLVWEALEPVDGVTLQAMNGGLHAVALLPGVPAGDEPRVVADLAARGVLVAGLSDYAFPDRASADPASVDPASPDSAFPDPASPDPASPDRVFSGGACSDEASPGRAFSGHAFSDQAFSDQAFSDQAVFDQAVFGQAVFDLASRDAATRLPAGIVVGYAEPTTVRLVEALAAVGEVLARWARSP